MAPLPPDLDYLKRRVTTVLTLAEEARSAFKVFTTDNNRNYRSLFQQYRSAGLSFLEEAYGREHNYYEDFKRNVGTSANYDRIAESVAVLLAVQSGLNDRTAGKPQVATPLKNEELDQAAAVLAAGNKDMAAIMLGILVEKQLEHLCAQHGLELLAGRRGEPGAEERNRALAKAGAYSRAMQQQVTAWMSLRNSAAHGNFADFGEPEVTRMLAGVRDFLAAAPAAACSPEPATPAALPPADDAPKLRHILKNVRKRLRQLHEILAAEDIPDAKKVKKIRFVVNLLLPPPEQPAQPEKAST